MSQNKIPIPELRDRIFRGVGEHILKLLESEDNDITAPVLNAAMNWIKDAANSNTKDIDPVTKALESLQNAKKVGGKVPPISNEDDYATK